MEEWKQLRDEGQVTPDVAIWFPIWPGAESYKWAMDNVYSNPEYDDMILRDQNTGRKVVHVVANGELDDSIIYELENDYGVTIIYNWALQVNYSLHINVKTFFLFAFHNSSGL